MEFLYFLGRFHPLLLHLPIGFLLLAFLLEIASRRPQFTDLAPAVPFSLVLGAGSAVLTALLGYFLSLEGGYEGSSLNIHKYAGISLAALSIVLVFLRIRMPEGKMYMPLFIFTMVLMAVTGHYGGNLTHGSNYLTEHAPKPVRRALGLPIKLDLSKVDLVALDSLPAYLAITQPIFDDKCVSCHNPDKMKGELRLDVVEGIRAGGETGPVFVAGRPDSSLLLEVVHLPMQDDKHMPPDGKEQLSDDEIALLEWWIADGGDFEKNVGRYDRSDDIQEILRKRFEPKGPEGVFALNIKPLDENTILELAADSLALRPVARESALLELNLANTNNFGPEKMKQLEKASKQLIKLNLSNTPTNDAELEMLGKFPNIVHLHLDRTAVTDEGLKALTGMEYLEYLNLYQTAITDKGLETLAGIPSLKKIYLWQTQTTPEGIEKLRSALPEAYVDTGMDTDFVSTSGSIPAPEVLSDGEWFEGSAIIELTTVPGTEIRYTLDGTEPDSNSTLYADLLNLESSVDLKARAYGKDRPAGPIVEKTFIHVRTRPVEVSLETMPDPKYPGLGVESLYDLRKGSAKFRDGDAWLGWEKINPSATFDLGSSKSISKVMISSLEDSESWVFFPRGAKVSVSADGNSFREVADVSFKTPSEPSPANSRLFEASFPRQQARYVKVEVQSRGVNPSWHASPGEPCWVFIDEIIVD